MLAPSVFVNQIKPISDSSLTMLTTLFCQSTRERVQLSEFMNAILEAQGIDLDIETSGSRRGRSLSYRAKVRKNGTIIVSAGYTREMGLEPGQPFEIKLGRKAIKLTAVSSERVDEFEALIHDDDEFDSDEIE